MPMPEVLTLPTPNARQPSLDVFDRVGVSVAYRPGEEIFAQGDEGDTVYRLLAGSVRASRVLSDGRRQIAGFYYGGDLFGLETGQTRHASAEALVDTRVLVVRRSCLKHYGALGEQDSRDKQGQRDSEVHRVLRRGKAYGNYRCAIWAVN